MKVAPALLVFSAALGSVLVADGQMPPPTERPGKGVITPRNPQPTAPGNRPIGTIHFKTKLGSFKMIDGIGKVDMTFSGTVMFNKYKGAPLKIEGKVKQEYDDKRGRVALFGTGRIVFSGEWRGVQWFGTDMNAVWTGNGNLRIVGDFDKNLSTGTYWYDDPKKVQYWPTAVWEIGVPERKYGATAEPKERPKTPQPGAK